MNRNKFFKYWLPVGLYALLIFILSSIPRRIEVIPGLPHLDKVVHLIEYGILGFLLNRAFVNSGRFFLRNHSAFLAILIAICYGISDEFHQSFVPNRNVSLYDVLFDGMGAALAQVVLYCGLLPGGNKRLSNRN